MRDVNIIGIGQTPVGEHWDYALRHLALEAIRDAANDAHIDHADALFIGNMAGAQIGGQTNLGALIADFVGLRGIEAVTVEASSASGGAALRQAYLGVASGAIDFAIVVGVDKLTDVVGTAAVSAQLTATDADYEASHGVTPLSAAAMIMRRYMHEYDAVPQDFAAFSVNAHNNAVNNPNAMFHNKITPEAFVKVPMIADPIGLFDAAPAADGAAAVVLAPTDWACAHRSDGTVRIAATPTERLVEAAVLHALSLPGIVAGLTGAAADRGQPLAGLAALAVSPVETWRILTLDERRAVLRLLVERVSIGRGRRGGAFDPSRIEIDWRI